MVRSSSIAHNGNLLRGSSLGVVRGIELLKVGSGSAGEMRVDCRLIVVLREVMIKMGLLGSAATDFNWRIILSFSFL